jgi:hypothetical protein
MQLALSDAVLSNAAALSDVALVWAIWLTIVTRESLQSSRGYTSCFVVAVAVAVAVVVIVVVVVACMLVLYSIKQVENLPLQQGSHERMQFGILPLQQGNSRRVHAVWYPATAVWYPATAAGQQPPRACNLVSCH